jgi:hypothetical protein
MPGARTEILGANRYRVQGLRYWVQTTVAGAKIPGAKLASTTIKDGATSLSLVNNRRTGEVGEESEFAKEQRSDMRENRGQI